MERQPILGARDNLGSLVLLELEEILERKELLEWKGNLGVLDILGLVVILGCVVNLGFIELLERAYTLTIREHNLSPFEGLSQNDSN